LTLSNPYDTLPLPIIDTLDTLAHITPTSIPCGHIYVLLPKWGPLSTHMGYFRYFSPYYTHFYRMWAHLCTFAQVGPTFDPYGLTTPIKDPCATHVGNISPYAPGKYHMGPICSCLTGCVCKSIFY